MRFLADIEVEEGLKDSSGGLGTNGQILSSTGSLTSWINTTATGNWTLSGNNIYNNNSANVGIGITTPTSKLHINQNVTNPDLDQPESFAVEIDSNHSGSDATTSDREQGGLFIDVDSSTTGGDAANEHRLYGIYNNVNHTGDADLVYGSFNVAEQNTTTGTTTTIYGISGTAISDGGANAVLTAMIGSYGLASMQDATPVSNSYAGNFFNNSTSTRTGLTTNTYGVKSEIQIDSTSAFTNLYAGRFTIDSNTTYTATNSYLLYLDYSGTSLATNTYAIYSVDDVKSYHRGNFGINTNNPQYNLHVAGNARITGAYYDSTNSAGSNGQVLNSTNSGTTTTWVTPTTGGVTSLNTLTGGVTLSAGANISVLQLGNTITISGTGGGGTISGTIANQEIAVGTSSDTIGGEAYFKWTPQSGLQLGNNSQGGGANIITIDRPSGLPGKFIIEQGSTAEFSIVTGGDTTMSTNTNDLILTDDTTAKVGVGNTSPSEKLDVTGRIKASAGVQVGNETSTTAASGLVGTFRYRLVNGTGVAGSNYSYVDMCMQTDTTGGLSSYEWVNVITNRW